MRKFERQPLFNLRMLGRIVGVLLLIESGFLLMPLAATIIYKEKDLLSLAITTALTFLSGLALLKFVHPHTRRFGKRDGFLLTSVVWVVFSIFGMLPFIFSSTTPIGISDAFFEAMSGFTTTGASSLGSHPDMSHGLLLWRSVMQWVGGLGIILFTLAVLPMFNTTGGMQMFNAEVTGVTHDKIRPRVSQTAMSLWSVYLLLTLLLIVLLWVGPMDFFDSVCTAFGTISTGGYTSGVLGMTAIKNDPYVKMVMTAFMLMGGINFALIYKFFTGQSFKSLRGEVLRIYLLFIAIMWSAFAIAEVFEYGIRDMVTMILDPLFQVVAISTSTGISHLEISRYGGFILMLTLFMMFFGGCAGSTSGGAKIDRMIYLFKHIRNELYRCIYPNSVLPVTVDSRVASPALLGKVTAFLCVFVIVTLLGATVLTLLGVPMIDAIFSSFSCISNTGFGTDITGLGMPYDALPASAKWVLSFVMLVGRLEIFSVLVMFIPSFWKRS